MGDTELRYLTRGDVTQKKEQGVPRAEAELRGKKVGRTRLFSWDWKWRLSWHFVLIWLCLGVSFVALSCFGENGLETASRLRDQRTTLERENRVLRTSNERLRQEIRLAKQKPAFLEWLARDRLGMIGENERVYLFQE